jgi:hypothetical protein
MHVTDFSSKQTGDWTKGKFCHTLASSGGSSNNFGTLGGKSPPRGSNRRVKCNYPIIKL